MNIDVQKQIITVILTSLFVLLMEILLYVAFVVPVAETGLRSSLSRDHEDGRLYDNTYLGTLRAVICTLRGSEAKDIKSHNNRLLFNAFLIVLLPVVLLVVSFSVSPRLRQASMKYVVIDVTMGVLLLVMFQGLFYVLGTKWQYTAMEIVNQKIVEQYKESAGEKVCVDRTVQALLGVPATCSGGP